MSSLPPSLPAALLLHPERTHEERQPAPRQVVSRAHVRNRNSGRGSSSSMHGCSSACSRAGVPTLGFGNHCRLFSARLSSSCPRQPAPGPPMPMLTHSPSPLTSSHQPNLPPWRRHVPARAAATAHGGGLHSVCPPASHSGPQPPPDAHRGHGGGVAGHHG